MEVTPFRRAFITDETRRVAVEMSSGERYVLPGNYDAAVVLARIVAARFVNLERWEKF